MFVLGNLLGAIATVLGIVLRIYMFIIVIRAIISWFSPDPYNSLVQILYAITEPILYPIRTRLPFGYGIDFSPLIVILIIIFLQAFAVSSLRDLAFQLR
jgi:YggT family protein